MMKKRAKILDNPPKYGTPEWGWYQYERAKEVNRGHNYRYWNDKWWDKEMAPKGWEVAMLSTKTSSMYCTESETLAQKKVEQLRKEGNYARIVAGMCQNRQRMKMFTVIYKSK